MVILVTAGREWKDLRLMTEVLKVLKRKYPGATLVQGGCRGGDLMAHKIGISLQFRKIVTYPALWDEEGSPAGPLRNIRMLDEEHPDVVVGFHKNIVGSKGTAHMLREAKKRGIRTFLFPKK